MAAQVASSNLTPALFRSLFPQPYLERFISEGVRPDGRPVGDQVAAADSWRDVSVNTGASSFLHRLVPPEPGGSFSRRRGVRLGRAPKGACSL